MNRRNIFALSIMPIITLVLVFTNAYHGLVFSKVELNPADPTLPLILTQGLVFGGVVVAYSYAVLSVGSIMLVRRLLLSRRSFRVQAYPLLIASSIPWLFNMLYLYDQNLFGYVEPTSLALTLAGMIVIWRTVSWPGLYIAPIAREVLIDSMSDFVIVVDYEGRVVDMNPMAEKLIGRSYSEVMGQPIESTWPEWSRVSKVLDDKTSATKEVSFGTGEKKQYYELESTRLPGFTSDEINLLITLRDITKRKLTDERLRLYSEHLEELVEERTKKLVESESRFRELADLLPQPVLEIDNEAKFTFVNRAAFALTGYTEEDMRRGVNALDLVVPEDRERLVEAMMRILGGEHTSGYEYTVVRKDGSTFPVFLYAVRAMRGNEIAGVRGIAVDISERKRMEEQLLRSERLASIGETAAMVGHDLRNPLQAMTNTLYLVKRLAASGKGEDRKEAVGLLGTLHDAIQYMDKIVSDLQDYARPVGAAPIETNLPDLVKATASNVKISAGVEVTVDIQGDSSKVKLDPILFRRVLTNLILNAVQAMPKGGKLTITGSRADESFSVAVQDTGVGIAPENLGRVFNPFFTTKAQGQGLGLAVCKRLMEAQGGTIEAASRVGEGSTFTLKIPTNRTLGAT